MIQTGLTLIVLAAVCAVAAAVGGNVRLPGGVEFPHLPRPVRVALTGLTALFVSGGIVLLVMGGPTPDPVHGPTPDPTSSSPTPTRSPTPTPPVHPPSPTNCTAAAIRVEPGTGSAGTDVDVVGECFPPNAIITVYMYLHAEPLTMTRTDESGAFLATFTVPAAWRPELLPLDAPVLASTNSPAVGQAQQSFLVTP
jgi:hypothetical protein